MNLSLDNIQQLRTLHESAMKSADAAIEYARQAGQLLSAVKAELPHGQFTAWVQSLGFMDLRMAQRYMAVASGKPYTIGGRKVKNDAASFLEDSSREIVSGKWVPMNGHWYIGHSDKATFWVVPWDENETWFHISKLFQTGEISLEDEDAFDDASFYVGTLSPIPASLVEGRLKYYGMLHPSEMQWTKKRKPGLARPFGEPENYQDRLLAEARLRRSGESAGALKVG